MATSAPNSMPLGTALDRNESLAGLLQRVRESRARFEAIAGILPPGLKECIRPGPLDSASWVLLVPHAAAAAKVRQILPALHDALLSQGWSAPAIKIKVLPPAQIR